MTHAAKIARQVRAMAKLQYAQGHQSRAQRPPVAKPVMAPKGAVPPKNANAMFFFDPGEYD